ncbi:MAG: carbamate kinase [Mycoplasmataceae bacterium]|nr:carbamate kinase [Mycoplasmataceae bacterium]
MTKKIVIALGGNALGNNPKEQLEAVKITAQSIVDLIAQGNKVIISHGNGPQVGMISLAFSEGSKVNKKIPQLPLSLAGAMSQGYIGLHLQQAIKNELILRNLDHDVISLITQTEVDPNDPSFSNPTKPIGLFYTKEQAKELAKKEKWIVAEDSNRGWRRMVPSPLPINIIEKNLIKHLSDKAIVIAGGGGGVPTIIKDNTLIAVDAVIDKDFTSAKIAELVDADMLMIVTASDGVFINYGKKDAKQLSAVTVLELEELLAANEFPAGSMKPKVEAAVSFVKSGKKKIACISDLHLVKKTLNNEAGTWITH